MRIFDWSRSTSGSERGRVANSSSTPVAPTSFFPEEDVRHPRRAVPREDLRVPPGNRATFNEFIVLSDGQLELSR